MLRRERPNAADSRPYPAADYVIGVFVKLKLKERLPQSVINVLAHNEQSISEPIQFQGQANDPGARTQKRIFH